VAAHAGDIVKRVPGAYEWDVAMSDARKNLDWDRMLALALDPRKARQFRESSKPQDTDLCTMCGEYCAMKKVKGVLRNKE
jgi:phosphomethylpyrimidine synthase